MYTFTYCLKLGNQPATICDEVGRGVDSAGFHQVSVLSKPEKSKFGNKLHAMAGPVSWDPKPKWIPPISDFYIMPVRFGPSLSLHLYVFEGFSVS